MRVWREIQKLNIFQLPVIDASNKTGSMEFACGGNADDFFPVRVSFYSKKSYSDIQVLTPYRIIQFEEIAL